MATRIEVTSVNKTGSTAPHDRIRAIGGTGWRLLQEWAVDWIEKGEFSYYINRDDHQVDVVVARGPFGHKYLKTNMDDRHSNHLLNLPECPQAKPGE